jgi:hypothetical protein
MIKLTGRICGLVVDTNSKILLHESANEDYWIFMNTVRRMDETDFTDEDIIYLKLKGINIHDYVYRLGD